jgi:hypothetical protein
MPHRCDGWRYKDSKKINAMKVKEDVRIFKFRTLLLYVHTVDAGV